MPKTPWKLENKDKEGQDCFLFILDWFTHDSRARWDFTVPRENFHFFVHDSDIFDERSPVRHQMVSVTRADKCDHNKGCHTVSEYLRNIWDTGTKTQKTWCRTEIEFLNCIHWGCEEQDRKRIEKLDRVPCPHALPGSGDPRAYLPWPCLPHVLSQTPPLQTRADHRLPRTYFVPLPVHRPRTASRSPEGAGLACRGAELPSRCRRPRHPRRRRRSLPSTAPRRACGAGSPFHLGTKKKRDDAMPGEEAQRHYNTHSQWSHSWTDPSFHIYTCFLSFWSNHGKKNNVAVLSHCNEKLEDFSFLNRSCSCSCSWTWHSQTRTNWQTWKIRKKKTSTERTLRTVCSDSHECWTWLHTWLRINYVPGWRSQGKIPVVAWTSVMLSVHTNLQSSGVVPECSGWPWIRVSRVILRPGNNSGAVTKGHVVNLIHNVEWDVRVWGDCWIAVNLRVTNLFHVSSGWADKDWWATTVFYVSSGWVALIVSCVNWSGGHIVCIVFSVAVLV